MKPNQSNISQVGISPILSTLKKSGVRLGIGKSNICQCLSIESITIPGIDANTEKRHALDSINHVAISMKTKI
ncbi:hypothetical protein VAS14_11904 [Photobacterium angustum S14]|uniref:Uncharacterized protein n=1 Tax=Photobacterium angustum (strain S14 / CCUG 15956) TaxID=314292 RepID=Q1ZVP4_PHOAS|nr:hypothetical protein VAS14_11904 [Photobacterium angustum S14]